MAQECNIEKIRNVLKDLLKELKEIQPATNAIVYNNEQLSERQNEEKRPSWWVRVKKSLRNIGKMRNEAANQASDHGDGSSQGGSSRGSLQNIDEDQRNADLEIQKLQSDILQMKTAFDKLSEFQNQMSESLERDFSSNKLKAILKKTDSVRSRSNDLNNIRRKISNLKCQIPSLLLKQSSKGLNITDSQTAEENSKIDETGSDISLPGLHVSQDFVNSSAFEEVLDRFEGLTDFTQKLCLLSFAVFPENREVKRTMLMYWWIGEGFISSNDSENSVSNILDEFLSKGLLEAVEDERKLTPNSYKMEPHVHSVVINLAKSVKLFNLYSSKGNLIMNKSSKHKVCLVKGSSLQPEAKTSAMQPKNLNTVFNSSERYPDFTFKWFPFMDSLRVLYLGRWERTAKRHIEVESTDFLKNMKALKNLRLASFQGISRIEKLENSICELPNLEIFDLRACYNLEALPEDIRLLGSLVYLDVSECFMLDQMPNGISQLTKLQVLKGFVISQSDDESNCAVKHLVNLRKLSITVNRYSFKVEKLMESLIGLKQLESLKIAWGARFPEDDQKGGKSQETNEAEEKESQNKKEQEDEQVQKKGQSSQEKRGDVGEVGPEVGTSSKKEDENGDGRIEKADLEKGKNHEEVKAESLKSDQVRKGNEGKVDPGKAKEKTSEEGNSNVEEDGDKGKVVPGEGKMSDEVKAESMKSDKAVVEEKNKEEEGDGDKKKDDLEEAKKSGEVKAESLKSDRAVVEEKKTSLNKEEEGDGDKGMAGLEEGKKSDEVKAENLKSAKLASHSRDATGKIQNKPDDQKGENKVEGGGDKGKDDLKEGMKQEEVQEEKSENDVEAEKKANPPRESSDPIQKKPDDNSKLEKEGNGDKGRDDSKTDDKSKMEKQGDGDKGKADPEEGKKQEEVVAEKSKSEKVGEGDEKKSPPQESKDIIQNKTDDKSKVEKEGDGDKGKADPEEGKKNDEVEAESSKSSNAVEGAKIAKPSGESADAIQNKLDDHQRDDKQEEKGDGEKEKVNLEERKKKDEVIAESSKPDKVIERDAKTSPPQESKDTIREKSDDHKENSKVQEKEDGQKNGDDSKKLDGEEAKTQKSDKNKKFGKKVSFSENSIALKEKKPDDEKRDSAMDKEIHERRSLSKESGSRKPKWYKMRNETRKWIRGHQETPKDAPKLPSSLKKLELECFPEKDPPSWLNPKNLDNLKKLSIRGGNLSKISDDPPTAENSCQVQILRLKYLHQFKAEWKDLKALFPQMTLLEKYKCPKVSFCPTDGNGVWRSQPQASPNM